MQLSKSLVALFATVIVGVTAVRAGVVKRTGAVEFCPEINFQGACVNIFNPDGSCSNVGDDLNKQISSIHVEVGTSCDVFVNGGCRDAASLHITSDIPDLRELGFNDVISSFRCSA